MKREKKKKQKLLVVLNIWCIQNAKEQKREQVRELIRVVFDNIPKNYVAISMPIRVSHVQRIHLILVNGCRKSGSVRANTFYGPDFWWRPNQIVGHHIYEFVGKTKNSRNEALCQDCDSHCVC